MQIELALHPDDGSRLRRLKQLVSASADRRSQPLRIVWHDSPDRALLHRGLALAEQRGAWHLEHLTPQTTAWPPGAPPPRLEEAARLDAFTAPLPEPLAPVAAFAGRQASFLLPVEEETVTLVLQRGVLRAVTRETPVCRLLLHGNDEAVLAAARTLAQTLRLSVPRASLAAEALAGADGTAPSPRALGAPRLPTGLTVPASFAFILGHLTDVLLHYAPTVVDGRGGTEPVHQMRVAVRRARSAIRLFHPAITCPAVQAAEASLKALGEQLGPTRDWDVFATETLPTVADVVTNDPRLDRLAAAAERRRGVCHAALYAYLTGGAFPVLGIELACLAGADRWHPMADPAPEPEAAVPPSARSFAAAQLQRRWKKVLGDGKDVETHDAPQLHALRLRVKRLRYAAEFFAPLFPGKSTRRFIRRLSRLQERLGVMNDRSVAEQLLDGLGGATGPHRYAVGLVMGFSAADTANLQPRILRAWEKIHRHPPFWA